MCPPYREDIPDIEKSSSNGSQRCKRRLIRNENCDQLKLAVIVLLASIYTVVAWCTYECIIFTEPELTLLHCCSVHDKKKDWSLFEQNFQIRTKAPNRGSVVVSYVSFHPVIISFITTLRKEFKSKGKAKTPSLES